MTNIKDGTWWKERPTRRWDDKMKPYLTTTRRKNVTCGTVDLESCKTVDPSASSDELSGLLCGVRVVIYSQLPINKTMYLPEKLAFLQFVY